MKKNIYFVSDQHFGAPDRASSLVRERKFVKLLDEIKPNASELYILGDLFDVWYEYKHVVPKGFVRVLGKLAELADEGIQIHFFKRDCSHTPLPKLNYAGNQWPLPQTGQMWLEYELLKNPTAPGFFCVSTSYRYQSPNR